MIALILDVNRQYMLIIAKTFFLIVIISWLLLCITILLIIIITIVFILIILTIVIPLLPFMCFYNIVDSFFLPTVTGLFVSLGEESVSGKQARFGIDLVMRVRKDAAWFCLYLKNQYYLLFIYNLLKDLSYLPFTIMIVEIICLNALLQFLYFEVPPLFLLLKLQPSLLIPCHLLFFAEVSIVVVYHSPELVGLMAIVEIKWVSAAGAGRIVLVYGGAEEVLLYAGEAEAMSADCYCWVQHRLKADWTVHQVLLQHQAEFLFVHRFDVFLLLCDSTLVWQQQLPNLFVVDSCCLSLLEVGFGLFCFDLLTHSVVRRTMAWRLDLVYLSK